MRRPGLGRGGGIGCLRRSRADRTVGDRWARRAGPLPGACLCARHGCRGAGLRAGRRAGGARCGPRRRERPRLGARPGAWARGVRRAGRGRAPCRACQRACRRIAAARRRARGGGDERWRGQRGGAAEGGRAGIRAGRRHAAAVDRSLGARRGPCLLLGRLGAGGPVGVSCAGRSARLARSARGVPAGRSRSRLSPDMPRVRRRIHAFAATAASGWRSWWDLQTGSAPGRC